MPSLKPCLCNIIIITVLFGLSIALAEEIPEKNSTKVHEAEEGPRGNCSCGGFATAAPDAAQLPLLSQTPGLVVTCGDEGNNTCKNLCTALATATKAKGPEILCNRLKNCNELKLSAFYRICDGPWVYADMTAEEPLCCADAAVRPCASAAAANDANAANAANDATAANATATQMPHVDASTPM